MKKATVRELQHHLSDVMQWVDGGNEVQITRHNRIVARLVPDQEVPTVRKWPDFYGRSLKIFPGTQGESLSQTLIHDRKERF